MKKRLLVAFGLLAFCFVSGARAADFDVRFQATAHDAVFAIAADGNQLLAVGALGLVVGSSDDGKSWARQTTATPAALLGVAMSGDKALAVGQGGVVLRREGNDWRKVDAGTDSRLLGVALASDGLAIAVGGFGTLLRSEDAGASWEPVKIEWSTLVSDAEEPHLYAVRIVKDTIFVVGEFGLVMRSTDRGKTWNAQRTTEASLFDLTMDDQGNGLAVGQKGTITRTSDGGKTWQKVALAADSTILGIWRSGQNAEAVGIQCAFSSKDGGATWTADNRGDTATGWYQAVAGADRPIIVGHSGRVVTLGD